jgi:uncharacterized membrane protein
MVQGDFFMKNKMLKKMTFASMISAVYFVLCLIEGYIASGPVANIRFAEGLIVMALFVPETIFGAALGCFLYNLFFGFGIIDALIGTVATIFGGLFVLLINKIIKKEKIKLVLFGLGLVIFNAILVPIVLILNIPDLNWGVYWYEFMIVGIGELIAVYSVGIPLYFATRNLMNEKYS